MDLFESAQGQGKAREQMPLAERLRPQDFSQFVGQEKLLSPSSFITQALVRGQALPNLILWGPPGTGKTTFAQLLSTRIQARFLSVNAIDTGAKRLREIGQAARQHKLQQGEATILFIDEIHRLNRGQQDVLLPFTEKGDFTLVGATTENPSYELNGALISRCRVLVFESLKLEQLKSLAQRAYREMGIEGSDLLTERAEQALCEMAQGDGRQLLNLLEQVGALRAQTNHSQDKSFKSLDLEDLQSLSSSLALYYDRQGDEHYNCVSAFIKSLRGSDPDAAVYYLARMLAGGEDPLFIARRLVILASEDVGNADPRALGIAVAGAQAVEMVGLPEAAINLAQVTTYLASAPKSNRSYRAWTQARDLVARSGPRPVPLALRSAQTALARELGFGKDYQNSHQGPTGWVDQEFFPQGLEGTQLYEPSNRGFEKTIREYLAWMKGQRSGDSKKA
jgi:putative ATPase